MGSSSSNPQKITVERDEVSGTVKVVRERLLMLEGHLFVISYRVY